MVGGAEGPRVGFVRPKIVSLPELVVTHGRLFRVFVAWCQVVCRVVALGGAVVFEAVSARPDSLSLSLSPPLSFSLSLSLSPSLSLSIYLALSPLSPPPPHPLSSYSLTPASLPPSLCPPCHAMPCLAK